MDTNLTYSELIYLFANKAVSQRSKFFNNDYHPSGEKITHTPLAQKIVLAAICYLYDKKFISLREKDIKILFLFPGKKVFGKAEKARDEEVTGVEKVLLENFKEETEVSKAVYHLLDSDEANPWGQTIHISKDSLLQKGALFLEKERKNIFSVRRHLYDEKTILPLMTRYEDVEKRLAEFEKTAPNFQALKKAVDQGIQSRLEQSSSDD